jgi:hypothetical protein
MAIAAKTTAARDALIRLTDEFEALAMEREGAGFSSQIENANTGPRAIFSRVERDSPDLPFDEMQKVGSRCVGRFGLGAAPA